MTVRKVVERHPFGRWMTNFSLILLLVAGGYFVHWETAREARIRAAQLALETRQRCVEGQKNRAALRAIILRGRDVGKPGSPGYAYYHQHPAEAVKALDRVDRALHDLPPITC